MLLSDTSTSDVSVGLCLELFRLRMLVVGGQDLG